MSLCNVYLGQKVVTSIFKDRKHNLKMTIKRNRFWEFFYKILQPVGIKKSTLYVMSYFIENVLF
jgi:hypothetical protein